MKKLLPTAIILCLLLCSCGQSAKPTDSFACGSASDCAVADDMLVTVCRGSMKCFGLDGVAVLESSIEQGEEMLSATLNRAAAFCAGGQTVAFSDGTVIDTEKSIISVKLSESGHSAVCAHEAGYMGLVTVYDAENRPVYRWYSAAETVITAAVSPDGCMLAVLTEKGVHLFSLENEAERGMHELPDMSDVLWLEDTVCAIGDKNIVTLTDTGKFLAELRPDDEIGVWCASNDALAVQLGDEMLILSTRLNVRDRIKTDGFVLDIDMQDDELVILMQDAVCKYKGASLMFSEPVSGVSAAMLLKDGSVLVVGGGSARII